MRDRAALFQEIFSKYNDRVYRLCCSYATDEEDRRDLHQEVLFKVWKGLSSFNGSASPGTWVYRVAVNASIDFLRKSRKRKSLLIHDPVDNLPIADESQDIERNAAGSDRIETLYGLLRELPFVDRTIASLYLDSLSHRQISEVLGMSVENVGVRIHRIKKKLSKLYRERSS